MAFTDWVPVIILATLVPAFVAAIILMFSRFFESKHLEQAAKTELVFAGSTVFIVLAVLVIFTPLSIMLTSIGNDLLKSAGSTVQYNDLIDITKELIKPKYNCMRDAMGSLYYLSTFFEMSSTVYIEVFMSEVSSGFIYKVFTERIINTTSILTFYMYVYFIMIHILSFIKYTAIGLFMPMGIILRAFPPTRGAGAYVMAFALGLYFIFPLSFIVMNFITLDYTYSASTGFASPTYCSLSPAAESEQPSSVNIMDQTKQKESESWLKRYMPESISFLDRIDSIIKKLTISVCLTPIMAMVVTLTFVLSGTSLFGGNIPEVGRGLVKLI